MKIHEISSGLKEKVLIIEDMQNNMEKYESR